MKFFTITFLLIFMIMCFSSVTVKAQDILWDFEDENDAQGFTLRCLNPATPAADDPTIAGDEAVTGVGGDNGLPAAGLAWSVGPPTQYDGQIAAYIEGCHADATTGVLTYGPCNDPFGADFEHGFLNTYNLSQWGDDLHDAANDQIATSPLVTLSAGAMLSVFAAGGGPGTAPDLEPDPANGYYDGSSGIAVLTAEGDSLLASVGIVNHSPVGETTLDLSAFAGQTVIIEVVDAFQGGWGWLAVDDITITNASITDIASEPSAAPSTFGLMQNYPNPFNPSTTIEYTLGKNTKTEIVVYDLLGNKIATLMDGYQNMGTHKVAWDASGVSAGVYIYQIKTEDFIQSKKMILVK